MNSTATFQQYSGLINEFYYKLIKTHKNKYSLLEKFTKMNHDVSRKNQNSAFLTQIKKKGGDDSGSVSARSKSNKSYRTVRQVALKSVDAQYLYLSPNFRKVFCYAFLHSLIDKQIQQVFNMLETKVKLFLNTKQRLPHDEQVQIDKAHQDWKKITQLPSHKDKVRWQKILGDSLNRFPEAFINILLKSILSATANSDLQIKPTIEWFNKIAAQLKYSIIYLEYEQKKLINKLEIGHYQQKFILVNLKSDEEYALFDKIPGEDAAQSISTPINNPPSPLVKTKTTVDRETAKKQAKFYESTREKRVDTSGNRTDLQSLKNIDRSVDSFDKSPKVKSPSVRPDKLRKQALKMVQNVIKEYTTGSNKIGSLSILNEQNSKDAKIRKLLSSRQKKQEI